MAKRMKIDPHCQRGNCCALKVLFNESIFNCSISS